MHLHDLLYRITGLRLTNDNWLVKRGLGWTWLMCCWWLVSPTKTTELALPIMPLVHTTLERYLHHFLFAFPFYIHFLFISLQHGMFKVLIMVLIIQVTSNVLLKVEWQHPCCRLGKSGTTSCSALMWSWIKLHAVIGTNYSPLPRMIVSNTESRNKTKTTW